MSHGQLARELLTAAETVAGELPFITAVSIGWHDDVETARDEIARAIKQVSQGKGVLILTDLFGGAPTNIAAMFLDDSPAGAANRRNFARRGRAASMRARSRRNLSGERAAAAAQTKKIRKIRRSANLNLF